MDFNVFDWKREEQIGLYLGMFVKMGLVQDSLGLQTLFEFAVDVSNHYYDNPYHSFHHAIDVTYITFYLIEDLSMAEQLDLFPSEKAILLLSALGHDVLHPGTNNQYQVNAKTNVFVTYGTESVLEKQSADFLCTCLQKHDLLQVLCCEMKMTKEVVSKFMQRIVDCIVKTDMMFHFSLLEQLIGIVEYHNQSVMSPSYFFI
jgi:hypothetical protein